MHDLRNNFHVINYPISFRNMREFGTTQIDMPVWCKAGLSLAAITVFGFIIVKVISTPKIS